MTDLVGIRAALAAMSDAELGALQVAAEERPMSTFSAGLTAAIAHACDWEIQRRRGIDFALSGPEEAIDAEDMATSLSALASFREMFKTQPRVVALFDAIGDALMEPPPTVQ